MLEYDVNNKIFFRGKDVFATTEEYLNQFPKEYKRCYLQNKKTLQIYRCSKSYIEDESVVGTYDTRNNAIIFSRKRALGHEIFHMASNDMENKQCSFETDLEIEEALDEGMTEYHKMKAFGLSKPGVYEFETFCVMMLENIPNIFRPYFIPSKTDLYNVFNRSEIVRLMDALCNYYDDMTLYYQDKLNKMEYVRVRKYIRDIIDNLINIELSMNGKSNLYANKFMDIISSRFISDTFKEIYPGYMYYADRQVNKKVRKMGV